MKWSAASTTGCRTEQKGFAAEQGKRADTMHMMLLLYELFPKHLLRTDGSIGSERKRRDNWKTRQTRDAVGDFSAREIAQPTLAGAFI